MARIQTHMLCTPKHGSEIHNERIDGRYARRSTGY